MFPISEPPFENQNILDAIRDITTGWPILGTYLNIEHSELEKIELQYGRDIERCKLEMVHHWKQNDSTANWTKLRQAVLQKRPSRQHHADVTQSPKTDANADDESYYYTFEPFPAEESGL